MSEMILQVIKFFIPSFANVLFRILAFGYKNKKRLIIGLTFYAIYMLPVQFLLNWLLGYQLYLKVFALFVLFAHLTSVLLFSSDTLLKTLFLLLFSSNITFLLSIICNAVMLLLGWNLLHLIMLMIPIFTASIWLGLKFCAKPLRFTVEKIKGNWIFMMLVPMFALTAGIIVTSYNPMRFAENPLYFLAITMLIECTFILYIYNLYKSVRQLCVFGKEQRQKEMLMSEIDYYEKIISLSKSTRHDMRHHNSVLMEYLTDNDISGAKKYLNDYDENLNHSQLESFCENSVANAVFRVYLRKTKLLNIDYSVVADISQDLQINGADFSSVLSNLLENACEAAEKVVSGKRHLSVRAITDKSTLNIEIRNSCTATELCANGLPKSTKNGGGVGLVSVKNTLGLCDGIMKINIGEEDYTTQIIIPIN